MSKRHIESTNANINNTHYPVNGPQFTIISLESLPIIYYYYYY